MTTTAELSELMADLNQLAESFWAGEAGIAREFLLGAKNPQDHVHWLQHQCYRELRGPGLLDRPSSRTRWIVENIADGLPAAETAEGRQQLRYQLHQIAEEFDHFKLYADILEDITGEPVRMQDIQGLSLPSDKIIEALRVKLYAQNERLARLAYDFTEGGGAGIFYAQGALETDDPLLTRIKDAGRYIYDDELPHGQHGVSGIELNLTTAEEFAEVRAMIVEIARERLRMRAEMHDTTISEERINEIEAGKIEPLKPFED
jgi:hypothetical protein